MIDYRSETDSLKNGFIRTREAYGSLVRAAGEKVRQAEMMLDCPDPRKAVKDAETQLAQARNLLHMAYQELSFKETYSMYLHDIDRTAAPGLSSDDSDGFIMDGAMYLKCHILPKIDHRAFRSSVSRQMYTTDISFCCPSLEDEVHALQRTHGDAQVFHSQRITVFFLHNYTGSDSTRRTDSDNHYTRKILNTVTSVTPGGGRDCRIILDTSVSDMIPTGTYITVYPGTCQQISSGLVLAAWLERLNFTGHNVTV